MSLNTERPAYRILATHGFYGPDDCLYEEGDEIFFDDEPNEEMEPLNQAAKVKLETYLQKLDDLGRIAAEKAGRPFIERPRTLDGALALATEVQRREMSIMGSKVEKTNIQRFEKDEVPETGKRGRGRPKGSVKTLSASA